MAKRNTLNARDQKAGRKKAGTGARSAAAAMKPATTRPAARKAKGSLTSHVLDAQRTLWKTGLSVLSRGGKLAISPVGSGMITESLQGGLKKLEEVFDQRVLDSLARVSMPSPNEIRRLIDRVAALESAVRQLNRTRGRK